MGRLSQGVTCRAEPRSQRRKPSQAVVRCCDKQARPAIRPSGFRSETDLGTADWGNGPSAGAAGPVTEPFLTFSDDTHT